MPKDKSPASTVPSGEEDGGASPASNSANENSLFDKPKPQRFTPSSSSGKTRLTAERREEIRQKFQNARRLANQAKSSRKQSSACSPCRMRRVRCDLKDLPADFVGPRPACSNCKERGLKCVKDESADAKAAKLPLPQSNNSPGSSSDGASGSSSRPYSRVHNTAPSSSGGSFFSSASNIGIEGGQFSLDSSSNRNHTNFTINLHHGPPAESRSPYEPFEPITAANPSALQGSMPFSQDYGPYFGYPDYNTLYHSSSPFGSSSATGHSFPSTRHIRDGFNPAHPYGTPRDWLSTDWFNPQERINNSQWTGSESSSLIDPVALWSGFQNINALPLSQSSSSDSSANSSERMVVAQDDHSAIQSQDQSENSGLQTQKSSDIYCRHLSVKQRGFPLWIPEPNCYLPIQYQRKGISIGDVGIITAAGSFDYLFNVLLAHDHPFNVGRVPPGFSPLSPPLDPSDIRGQLEFRSNSYIASSTVRRTLGNPDDLGTTFHISASEGAILTIPDGALSEDLGNLVLLRRYMSENVESWYRHANGPRGRELANGDLRLVIGCDKTTAWGMAAFANLSQGEDTRLRFKPVGTSQFQTYGWELQSGTAEVRSGPDAREIRALSAGDAERGGELRPYENQCIFVRTLNATLHDTAWLELMAELSVPGGSGGNTSIKDIEMSSTTSENTGERPLSRAGSRFPVQTVSADAHTRNRSAEGANNRVTVHKPEVPAYLNSHPSKSLNAAILQQYMDARMAITDDSDWSSVLTEHDIVMPKPRHLTERILANSTPIRDATGVVYLEKNSSTLAPVLLSSSTLADFAFSIPPLTLPPLSDVDDATLSSRRTSRIVPMRHQSGSPSSM